MNKPRTVAIIQARMGSSRLPGKVLLDIAGRPLLAYVVERISRARTLDEIVVATTTNERDNVIIEECEQRGFPNFRGSETDVLRRYVCAARASRAGIIVRVTADNPFTDPDSIDRAVDAIAAGADYAIETNLPVGTTGEAITWNALDRIDSVANTRRWREHVTLYAKENPKSFKSALLTPPDGYNRPELRFTVDHEHEYRYVREIAESFETIDFGLKDLITAADNAGVNRNSDFGIRTSDFAQIRSPQSEIRIPVSKE